MTSIIPQHSLITSLITIKYLSGLKKKLLNKFDKNTELDILINCIDKLTDNLVDKKQNANERKEIEKLKPKKIKTAVKIIIEEEEEEQIFIILPKNLPKKSEPKIKVNSKISI